MEFGIQILSSVNDQLLVVIPCGMFIPGNWQFNNFLNNSNDAHVVFKGCSQTFGGASIQYIMYTFLMEWKRPYYLNSDIMGHPRFGEHKLYGLDRWKISLFL